MKIEILDPNSPYGVVFTLMSGGVQSPEQLRMDAEVEAQVQQGLRSVDTVVYNRGNMHHRFEFASTRQYNSVREAEVALVDYPYNVPTTGIIRFTPEQGGAGDVRYMRNGTVHAFAAQQVGLAILWHFTVSGGALSNTPPP